MKRLISIHILIMVVVSFLVVPFISQEDVSAEKQHLVFIVPVEHGIERGLERFLERAFKEAEEAAADAIILEIDTLGGAVDAALGIGGLIQDEEIPVIAFIKRDAISAGAYISLNADHIYMQPGSNIGAAAVRTISGEEADPKITSYWASKMAGAAKLHGRDPEIAVGMVDVNSEIPGIKKKGELITLDSEKALEYGIADGIVKNRSELLKELNMEGAFEEEVKLSPSEQLARFVTNPYLIPFLLIIGIAGIVIELMIPGFGVPGIVGLSAFALYFFGHFFAGFAGLESIFLFLIGVILMLIELFVPGFGIFGIIGILSLSAGIAVASYETTYGLISLAIAIAVNTVIVVILIKYFGHRGVWNRFILKEEQKKEGGYVSHTKDKNLVGKKGVSLSKLRPSGMAMIEGKRYDVVTEGGFIPANQPIEVIFVEGTRIVVKEISEDQ